MLFCDVPDKILLDLEIKELKKQLDTYKAREWISVEDRLPENPGWFMVFIMEMFVEL